MSGLLPGCVVLDQSASGQTLFVEPLDAVPLNNACAALGAQQTALEAAVLAGLSAKARRCGAALRDALGALVAVDTALAMARHAAWAGGARVRFAEAGDAPVTLRGARHPLLLAPALPPPPLRWWEEEAAADAAAAAALAAPPARARSTADAPLPADAPPLPLRPPPPVAVDWLVPPGAACVVISGPNTGGKTACMKTLALACLLARAGGSPPAASASLPWARRVLADLGDSQSLQEGLSTFSGHVARLGRILRALRCEGTAVSPSCEGVALVLLDEPGGGTDPAEGAALACALLQRLAAPEAGALTVATSHYEEAKRLAQEGPTEVPSQRRFANAAVEFDAAALAPTYRLLWGVSGESYALEVAAALGLPAPLLAAAAASMAAAQAGAAAVRGAPGGDARSGALAARLEAQRDEAEAAASVAAARRAAATADAAALAARAAALLPGEAALASAAEASALAAQAAARASFAAVAAALQPADALAAALTAHMPPGWELSGGAAAGAVRRIGAPDAPLWVPRVGERVLVRRLGARPAVVIAASAAEVEVKLGMLVTRVPLAEVAPAGASDLAAAAAAAGAGSKSPRMPTPRVSRAAARDAAAAPATAAAGSAADAAALVASPRADNTVDVRGMYADAAVAAVEAAMGERGRRAGASALFVVHGVGTGRVKAAVAEMLKTHPLVLRAEPAQQRDGGAGCTVVFLR
jgi:DNA mismatch repair protein MutS2